MRVTEFITEALRPSQYREYVKGWDKSKWADIFGGKYRIYLELDNNATRTPKPNQDVVNTLNAAGYTISDYTQGVAYKSSDTRKQPVRIGKILSDTRLGIPSEIKQKFDHDPSRSAYKSDKLVVISRHPYDIAGMSTDRGWTSCMNLHNGEKHEYVAADVKQGTIVAYLINRNDTNITKPIARVLIKPFINIDNPSEVALGVEERVRGTASPKFASTVVNWANKINASKKLNGLFQLSPELYQDGSDILVIGGDKTLAEKFYIREIEHKNLRLEYVPSKLRTEKICLAAVQKDGSSLSDVPPKLRTEKICLAAVQQYVLAFRLVPPELRTEKICLAAVQQRGLALGDVPLELRTEKICLAAVQQNALALKHVPPELRTEKMCLAAVQQNIHALDDVPSKLQAKIIKKLGL